MPCLVSDFGEAVNFSDPGTIFHACTVSMNTWHGTSPITRCGQGRFTSQYAFLQFILPEAF